MTGRIPGHLGVSLASFHGSAPSAAYDCDANGIEPGHDAEKVKELIERKNIHPDYQDKKSVQVSVCTGEDSKTVKADSYDRGGQKCLKVQIQYTIVDKDDPNKSLRLTKWVYTDIPADSDLEPAQLAIYLREGSKIYGQQRALTLRAKLADHLPDDIGESVRNSMDQVTITSIVKANSSENSSAGPQAKVKYATYQLQSQDGGAPQAVRVDHEKITKKHWSKSISDEKLQILNKGVAQSTKSVFEALSPSTLESRPTRSSAPTLGGSPLTPSSTLDSLQELADRCLDCDDSELPSIFQGSDGRTIVERLVKFNTVGDAPNTVPPEKLREYVKHGEDLALRIYNEENFTETSKADCACLMWYLTARAASFADGKEFIKGSFHLVDPKSRELTEFLVKCRGRKQVDVKELRKKRFGLKRQIKKDAYERISSHYPSQTETQHGLDYDQDGDPPLPAGMKTILFANLQNGGCFFKLEDHPMAVPAVLRNPIRYKHFNIGSKSSHFMAHMYEWAKKELVGGQQEIGGYQSRREDDGNADLELKFIQLLDKIKHPVPGVKSAKELESLKRQWAKQGLRGGIYTIKQLIKSNGEVGRLVANPYTPFDLEKWRQHCWKEIWSIHEAQGELDPLKGDYRKVGVLAGAPTYMEEHIDRIPPKDVAAMLQEIPAIRDMLMTSLGTHDLQNTYKRWKGEYCLGVSGADEYKLGHAFYGAFGLCHALEDPIADQVELGEQVFKVLNSTRDLIQLLQKIRPSESRLNAQLTRINEILDGPEMLMLQLRRRRRGREVMMFADPNRTVLGKPK